jgi:hypothetical protein
LNDHDAHTITRVRLVKSTHQHQVHVVGERIFSVGSIERERQSCTFLVEEDVAHGVLDEAQVMKGLELTPNPGLGGCHWGSQPDGSRTSTVEGEGLRKTPSADTQRCLFKERTSTDSHRQHIGARHDGLVTLGQSAQGQARGFDKLHPSILQTGFGFKQFFRNQLRHDIVQRGLGGDLAEQDQIQNTKLFLFQVFFNHNVQNHHFFVSDFVAVIDVFYRVAKR